MKYIIELNNETLEHTLKRCMNPEDVKQVVNALKNATPLEKVLEDIKAEITECIYACEELKSGKYPMIESEESLTNRILSYEQCISFIDNHISGKEQI